MNASRIRAALIAATLSVVLPTASDARAERIVLLQFTGTQASPLREKVAASLARAGHTVVRRKVPSRAVSTRSANARRALERLGKRSDAVISGRVERGPAGDWSIALLVHDPKQSASPAREVQFSNTSLRELARELADVSSQVEAAMASPEPSPTEATARAEVAVEDTPDDAVTGAAEDTVAGADDVARDQVRAIEGAPESDVNVARVRARAGYLRRDIDFYEDIYDHLPAQGADLWVYQILGEIYLAQGLLGQRLSLILSYERAVSGTARDDDVVDVTYRALHSELLGGLRARHPLGAHAVGLDLTFGRMASGLAGDAGARIPDLEYTLLHSSLDFELNFGSFNTSAALGFRLPLGFGEASETRWFPHMGGYGVDTSLGVSYPLTQRLSLEVVGSMRRYLMEMNSEPRDAFVGLSKVAAGAVDRYLSASVGLSLSL